MRLFRNNGKTWKFYPVGLPAGVVFNDCVMPMPIELLCHGNKVELAWCLDGKLIGRGKREPEPVFWRPYRPEAIMEIMAVLKAGAVV